MTCHRIRGGQLAENRTSQGFQLQSAGDMTCHRIRGQLAENRTSQGFQLQSAGDMTCPRARGAIG